MVQSGLKPKVVRMDAPNNIYDQKFMIKLIEGAFVGCSIGDVKVMYKLESNDHNSDTAWDWLEDYLPAKSTVVIGYKNVDGSPGCWIDQAVLPRLRRLRN